nr:Gfo/Idh/MocA family oxidoreductase [Maliibacterium massiliense]
MSKQIIRWGILGPGRIAHNFMRGLLVTPDAELAAIASRDVARAQSFAAEYNASARCYGSYEELAADPNVDAVYVATTNPHHLAPCKMMMQAGKAVVVEKPIALNAEQAKELVDCAKANDVFFMEGMWTRFFPVNAKVLQWIDQGRIGDVRMVEANFSFRVDWDPEHRVLDLAKGGGALLDVGIYSILYASMIMRGKRPQAVTGLAHLGETGVDEQAAYLMRYDDGALAVLRSGVRTAIEMDAFIYGTEGYIHVPIFWHPVRAELRAEPLNQENSSVHQGEILEVFESPYEASGFQYEIAYVSECLRKGITNCDKMPMEESLMIAEVMTHLRRDQWGMKYPEEA